MGDHKAPWGTEGSGGKKVCGDAVPKLRGQHARGQQDSALPLSCSRPLNTQLPLEYVSLSLRNRESSHSPH